MRDSLFKKITQSAFCALLICSSRIDADTIWSGGAQSGNVTVAPGNSLIISGQNFLTTPVNIVNTSGSTGYVTIAADATITSSQELYFSATTGSIITVSVINDLTLSGTNGVNFLVTMSGGGTLDFQIAGGKTLSFTQTTTVGGGTIFLDNMINTSPTVVFQRFSPASDPDPDGHAFIEVGNNSAISFLGQFSGNSGTIQFDATASTSNIGRLILQINDGGAVVNEAASLTRFPVTLANIQFNQGSSYGNPELLFGGTPSVGNYNGLLIVNGNLTWNGLENNPFCELTPTSSTVIRSGFILGAGSKTTVNPESYIDYVVTVTNITVLPAIPDDVLNVPCERFLTRVIKDRNPAALIIDGNPDNSDPAQIFMLGNSAIYFRSGVDCLGNSSMFAADGTISFTINPTLNPSDEGSLLNVGTILLDVEGPLVVNGDSDPAFTDGTALQILSWQVTSTGGSVLIYQNDTNFPLRTYAQDAQGNYLQYGSGTFLINNKMALYQMHLQHTDEIHPIFDDNIAGQSSPTYVGGDRLNICCTSNLSCPCYAARVVPAIQFYNSYFDLHTSAAAVGLSLQIVNDFAPDLNNISQFIFYGNGRCIDNGTGRSLILGTEVGSTAADFQTIVSRDAQLDVMQTVTVVDAGRVNPEIDLQLTVSVNNYKVTPGITGNISGQLGVNTLFLAYASNISIGTQNNTFGGTSLPTLDILGEFFSFSTQGGDLNSPQSSCTTGQGGMFVDYNGVVNNNSNRVNFGMMVTKSSNGLVNLAYNQVFFDPRVGIAQWQLNLNDPSQLLIIGPDTEFSDYTLDWQNLMKDYCSTYSQPLFVPYEPTTAPFFPATLYPVVAANLNGLPTIQGTVDQMQVINSRLGDQVHLMIDGGLVREFVLLTGRSSGTAPVGVLALQNNALVGLGTAARNVDSLDASVVLGVNGVILMPNGSATVRLNVDTLINNYCHIVTGTAFGSTAVTGDRLLIDSVVPKGLRIKSDGVLDLTQFTSTLQTLVISGAVNMVLEPGAEVVLGGGNLIFEGDSRLYCEPDTSVNVPSGTSVASTDNMRVKFTGAGRVTFKENAQLVIPRGALLGVETNTDLGQLGIGIPITNQSWAFTDNAQFFIGSSSEYGGGFQIGDTFGSGSGLNMTFTLLLTGAGALLDLDSQGFLGLGAGIVNKPQTAPNTWLIAPLYHVGSITISVPEGTFDNQQTYSGDNNLAGLLAIINSTSSCPAYNFSFDTVNADILGGGNMVLLSTIAPTTGVQPLVQATAGVTNPYITAGIMSSKAALLDYPKFVLAPIVNGGGLALFDYLTMSEYSTQGGKTATIFRNKLGEATIGYILNSAGVNTIQRNIAGPIRGLNGTYVNPNNSLEIGAVGIAVDLSTNAPELSQLNPEQ